MPRLYHLIRRDELEEARAAGRVEPAPEGFVHLSAAHQVGATVDRFYGAVAPGELVVLEVEDERLEHLVWEEGEPGVEFPHLYGSLELDVVASVRLWSDSLRAELDAAPGDAHS